MKPFRFLLIVVFVSCFFFISCDKKDPDPFFSDQGTITGRDYGLCVCCGGWFIEINNEPYRFIQVPEESNIDLVYSEFPIEVHLTWFPIESDCFENAITVQSLEAIQ